MARKYGRIYTSIWADEDFRRLVRDAQRAYLMLFSQPQINNCGVLPYWPKKWVRLAYDEHEHALADALADLTDRRFIVVDEDTDELLVRTFIKHDGVGGVPQLRDAAQREFREIESALIRLTLVDAYPQLFADIAHEQEHEPLAGPLFEPVERQVG